MSDEHVLDVFNRDWVLADSKTKLRFYFRNCYHVFGFALNASSLIKTNQCLSKCLSNS